MADRNDHYKGLDRLLHNVRWTQRLLAIVAEVLILLSFAMSGMDVSLGGVMASVPLLKVLWAGMFALGIDTAFALSWVRVRQSVMKREWPAFSWNILLALGMSLIIFQPLALQLLQQSLNIDFNQALNQLGVNIVILTYARSGVAVFLGAILAMTNVESEVTAQEATQSKRKLVWLDKMLNHIAPLINDQSATPAQITIIEEKAAQLETPGQEALNPSRGSTLKEEDMNVSPIPEIPDEEVSASEPSAGNIVDLRLRQHQNQGISFTDVSGLSTYERVVKALELFPNISDRELGKLSGCAAATAKKHRETLKSKQEVKTTESED